MILSLTTLLTAIVADQARSRSRVQVRYGATDPQGYPDGAWIFMRARPLVKGYKKKCLNVDFSRFLRWKTLQEFMAVNGNPGVEDYNPDHRYFLISESSSSAWKKGDWKKPLQSGSNLLAIVEIVDRGRDDAQILVHEYPGKSVCKEYVGLLLRTYKPKINSKSFKEQTGRRTGLFLDEFLTAIRLFRVYKYHRDDFCQQPQAEAVLGQDLSTPWPLAFYEVGHQDYRSPFPIYAGVSNQPLLPENHRLALDLRALYCRPLKVHEAAAISGLYGRTIDLNLVRICKVPSSVMERFASNPTGRFPALVIGYRPPTKKGRVRARAISIVNLGVILLRQDLFESREGTDVNENLNTIGMQVLLHEAEHVRTTQNRYHLRVIPDLAAKTPDRVPYIWTIAVQSGKRWSEWHEEQRAESIAAYYTANRIVEKAEAGEEVPKDALKESQWILTELSFLYDSPWIKGTGPKTSDPYDPASKGYRWRKIKVKSANLIRGYGWKL